MNSYFHYIHIELSTHLFTDSAVMHHTIVKGTRALLQSQPILQNPYVNMLINKVEDRPQPGGSLGALRGQPCGPPSLEECTHPKQGPTRV
jgi:hypothetical protein